MVCHLLPFAKAEDEWLFDRERENTYVGLYLVPYLIDIAFTFSLRAPRKYMKHRLLTVVLLITWCHISVVSPVFFYCREKSKGNTNEILDGLACSCS